MLLLTISAGQNMTRDNFSGPRNAGFAVNDNNEPVSENIHVDITVNSVADTAIDINTISSEDWRFDVVDQWITSGGGVFFSLQIEDNRF